MSTPMHRCEIIPLPDHQVSFQIDGEERTRWHFNGKYPRPFFYPFNGPSGETLTRMGHPGAQNHDHHRSVWFAHNKVTGVDFWSDNTEARIRQPMWFSYVDGDAEAIMATQLKWYDGHDPTELLTQELVASVRSGAKEGETLLEVQCTFTPKAAMLEFGQTNFGFFAVRVARSIASFWGGGTITNSDGITGEPAIFGKQAKWMDYYGQVAAGTGPNRKLVNEGITYFDHPANISYPSHWHVREDGWMGASVCMKQAVMTTIENPLTLRYMLHAHAGEYDANTSATLADEFGKSPGFEVFRSKKKHRQYEVARKT